MTGSERKLLRSLYRARPPGHIPRACFSHGFQREETFKIMSKCLHPPTLSAERGFTGSKKQRYINTCLIPVSQLVRLPGKGQHHTSGYRRSSATLPERTPLRRHFRLWSFSRAPRRPTPAAYWCSLTVKMERASPGSTSDQVGSPASRFCTLTWSWLERRSRARAAQVSY